MTFITFLLVLLSPLAWMQHSLRGTHRAQFSFASHPSPTRLCVPTAGPPRPSKRQRRRRRTRQSWLRGAFGNCWAGLPLATSKTLSSLFSCESYPHSIPCSPQANSVGPGISGGDTLVVLWPGQSLLCACVCCTGTTKATTQWPSAALGRGVGG